MKSQKRRLPGRAAASLIASLLALACPPIAFAQQSTPVAGAEPGVLARRINLGVGKSVIIDLPRDASEIFVADPKVANAVVRSARKLYLLAVGGGQTTIFAMDPQGRQIAVLEVSIGRDVGELSRILKTAMPHTEINPRTVNDTIILTGNVDSAGEAQMALDIAKGFAGDSGTGATKGSNVINSLVIRGRDQVMLKVTIAEVQRDVLKQLGVTQGTINGAWGMANMANPFITSIADTVTRLGTLGGKGGQLGAEIRAYERTGVGRVLAEPTVTAVSGESAKFVAGGEIPVLAGQTCTPASTGGTVCTNTVNFKPYGVSLNFTPVVLNEGRILLRVATEVTEVDASLAVSVGGVSTVGFRTRKNETSVELPSGGSIVSAGLIQSLSRSTINGLPGLMNLPVLGALFRSRDYERRETELMIVVTPYIAKSVKPSEVAKPTDGFVEATDPQAVLLGRVNRIYSTAGNPQIMQNYKGRLGFIAD
jgi:pilus assembly protein CpaC